MSFHEEKVQGEMGPTERLHPKHLNVPNVPCRLYNFYATPWTGAVQFPSLEFVGKEETVCTSYTVKTEW